MGRNRASIFERSASTAKRVDFNCPMPAQVCIEGPIHRNILIYTRFIKNLTANSPFENEENCGGDSVDSPSIQTWAANSVGLPTHCAKRNSFGSYRLYSGPSSLGETVMAGWDACVESVINNPPKLMTLARASPGPRIRFSRWFHVSGIRKGRGVSSLCMMILGARGSTRLRDIPAG